MAFVLNKHNRLVDVAESDVDYLIKKGYRQVSFNSFYSDIDLYRPVLVQRRTGGLGDIITLLPSLELLARKAQKLYISFPKMYLFLVKHLQSRTVELVEFEYLQSHFEEFAAYPNVDLFCPCGIHEGEAFYRPFRNRIENFADALRVSPQPPKLNFEINDRVPAFSGGKILLQLKSNNIAKDWPLSSFDALARRFKDDNRFVVTLDSKTKLDNITAIINKPLEDLPGYIKHFDLVIGADSGAMHMAAALGVPTLWLFGPTDGELTLRYYDKSFYIQGCESNGQCFSPCYYSSLSNGFYCSGKIGTCMHSITVDAVYDYVNFILKEELNVR